MRIFKSKPFSRFARKEKVNDIALCRAVLEAGQGLIDADLGGGVIKQRIAREGGGKSRGFRTLILFRMGALAFFVHGFAKNERANIDELKTLKELAAIMLVYDDQKIQSALANETLIEVKCHEKTVP